MAIRDHELANTDDRLSGQGTRWTTDMNINPLAFQLSALHVPVNAEHRSADNLHVYGHQVSSPDNIF